MELLCIGLTDSTTSKMFTKGKTYEQRSDGTVIDDLGHQRFIGSSMSFIIRNTFNLWDINPDGRVWKAYFERSE